MTVTVRSLSLRDNLDDFLNVVDRIYADDPHYIRPLDIDVRQRLSRRHPYFKHAEGRVFTAYRGRECVGRVVAHRNDNHLKRWEDGVGFFGFLDTVDDAEVCSALMERAAAWHKSFGMKRLRGPITLNMAEEVGCLVDGFDSPPMLLMGHHRPYQAPLIEAAGGKKVKDAYAWRYEVAKMPERVSKARDEIAQLPEVSFRRVDMKNIKRDVQQLLDIYNDAWGESWGYVPLTAAEAQRTAAELKIFANPELTRIVDIDGTPSAFAYALPNLNQALVGLGGKLSPKNIAKLIWRTKVRGPSNARLIGLGIRSNLRHVKKYRGLAAFLYAELNAAGQKLGYEWGELSYTLDDNAPMNVAIKLLGGRVYKTYRVFELEL